jgi:aspartyl-tRNA(Asn)/glutamyl-tRNA(Gln) amidotransferase subunit C
MTFAKSDLVKVARLARLSLAKDEMDRLENDLDRIISFVAQLEEVNIDRVSPMAYPGEHSLCLREDVAYESLGRVCVKSSAGFEDGVIRVPKIIE